MPGVVRTRCGYSGGKADSPNYHDLKDHTETLQIQFDPKIVSYRQLLEIFWESHDYATPIKTQYKSAIYYLTPEQKAIAEDTRDLVIQGKLGQPKLHGQKILTSIEAATALHVAEIYHQKYTLQCNVKVIEHLKFGNRSEITDSILATRLNGYLAGYGNLQVFLNEVDEWVLPFHVKLHLLRVLSRGKIGNVVPIDETDIKNPLPLDFLLQQKAAAETRGKIRYASLPVELAPRKRKTCPPKATPTNSSVSDAQNSASPKKRSRSGGADLLELE